MKRRVKREKDGYGQLRTKIFIRTLMMVAGATAGVWMIYDLIFFGRFSEWMISLFEMMFRMDYQEALNLYQQTFRNYMDLIFMAVIGVAFFCIFWFYLRWFTKYFGEVNRGIDALIQEDAHDITMSPELSATEKKLNDIRHTLEKRKLDAQLAEQRKNDLVVYLAHDLKTPLTSVIGYLTLLRDEKEISEELRVKYLGISLDKAERLEELIDEFFEITRFNLSNIVLEYSRVNLTRLLEQLVFEFGPMFGEKHLNYMLHAEPDLMILCDADKMQRVLDNLLRNAVYYSFEGSTVEIAAALKADAAVITVVNQGNTIPKEKLGRIFEQFYRLDTARGSNSGGAGLGLAIAREIVELHHGEITVQSKEERTTFEVTIPVS